MANQDGTWPEGFPPGFAERFVPERLLGKGSFGSVWLARQQPLDRRVALKILHDEVLDNDAEVGRFTDEARITAALQHPHVVVVLDHGVESGIPWIAYEYLEGRSLRTLIPDGGLPWRDALVAVIQVADALDHAHARGVLHRDIKPDNVIEVQAAHYKVADFGLAKWTRQNHAWTRTGAVVGSPAYLSPEQIDGLEPGPGSDQYALGVTLFEMLTGQLPFNETPDNPVMLQHLKTPPPRPGDFKPTLPHVLDLVVERALAKTPEGRFASASELKSVLESILRGDSNAVMVRLRAKADPRPRSDVLSKTSGKWTAAALAGEGSGRRRPGPIWWAMAVAMPLVAGAYFGVKAMRQRREAAPVHAGEAPRATFRRLVALATPPRGVRVEYELDRLPPEGLPLSVHVQGVAREPLKLTSVEGSVLITGVAQGARVLVGTEELVMPRGLPAWVDTLASDRHASVSLRFLEPVSVELVVHEQPKSREVLRLRTPRSHRVLQRVTELKPGTRYTVRVKCVDPALFLSAAVTESGFTTLSAESAARVREQVRSLGSASAPERLRAAGLATMLPDPDAVPPAASVLQEKPVLVDPRTTGQLAEALAGTRDARALPGLRAALEFAPDPHGRVFVIQQIGRVRDPAGFDLVMRECERGGLPDEEESALALADALVASDAVRARDTFRDVAKDPARASVTLRRASVEGLALLGGADGVSGLGKLARFAPRELGVRAATGLGALGGAEACGELVRLFSGGSGAGDDGAATEAVLRGLGRCGRPEDAGPVVALLRAPLGRRLKRAAVATLAGLGGAVAEGEVLRRLDDPDAGVALAAAWAAGQLRMAAAVPVLMSRCGAPGGSAGRVPRALGQIGDRQAEGRLLELARAPATAPAAILDRAEALWALGYLGSRQALPELLRWAEGGDLYTRFRAVEALGWLGDAGGRAVLRKVAGDTRLVAALREGAQRSLKWLDEGRKGRAVPYFVDPAFPPVRTGIWLSVGEPFQAEAQGLCFLDPLALTTPPDPANLPPGARAARAALGGLVGSTGHCFVGRGDAADCSRTAQGELLLYALRADPDERTVGFMTVWIQR